MTKSFNLKQISGLASILFLFSACSQEHPTPIGQNFVTSEDPKVDKPLGDAGTVVGDETFTSRVQQGKIVLPSNPKFRNLVNSLPTIRVSQSLARTTPSRGAVLFGLPASALSQAHIFGGVITHVSDQNNERLGMLKLSDLPPIHSEIALAEPSPENFVLALVGCMNFCSASSRTQNFLQIPVAGYDQEREQLMLDLSEVGKNLNLVEIVDPSGTQTHLRTKQSKTTAFDYSDETLVFDIASEMIPWFSNGNTPHITTFKARWYLKSLTSRDPHFVGRNETTGVGFFMTTRSANEKIQRFSISQTPIKYFIKNVPPKYHAPFKAAFDSWNLEFENAIGRKVLEYEFIDESDPRSQVLIAGDVRFNIVEWDLNNVAPYGGLGPSIADQQTGQIYSANVLVQGPKILRGYKRWYEASQSARRLRASGQIVLAQKTLREANRIIRSELMSFEGSRYELALNQATSFRLPSQMPSYQDPIMRREDFDEFPANLSFDDYMHGYFIDLVAHELGHNLGLRHNFRGNLSDAGTLNVGEVSHSVMEYLGRGYRHLNRIGTYDTMAIQYGYLGKAPANRNLYCTDENVISARRIANSPECSRDDASSDPFGFFEQRLSRAIDLLTARAHNSAPQWTVPDMENELSIALEGLSLYAASAPYTARSWERFDQDGIRPTSASHIQDYILHRLKNQICDPDFVQVVMNKSSEAAKAMTVQNIQALWTKAASLFIPMGVYTAAELSCS